VLKGRLELLIEATANAQNLAEFAAKTINGLPGETDISNLTNRIGKLDDLESRFHSMPGFSRMYPKVQSDTDSLLTHARQALLAAQKEDEFLQKFESGRGQAASVDDLLGLNGLLEHVNPALKDKLEDELRQSSQRIAANRQSQSPPPAMQHAQEIEKEAEQLFTEKMKDYGQEETNLDEQYKRSRINPTTYQAKRSEIARERIEVTIRRSFDTYAAAAQTAADVGNLRELLVQYKTFLDNDPAFNAALGKELTSVAVQVTAWDKARKSILQDLSTMEKTTTPAQLSRTLASIFREQLASLESVSSQYYSGSVLESIQDRIKLAESKIPP
jgi:hypothetical protein